MKYKTGHNLEMLAANVGVLAIAALFAVLISCGGGGGGGGTPSEPARVDIDVDPGAIDTGDRTNIEVDIWELQEPAIAIKIQFPLGLTYVKDSSFYVIDGRFVDTGPDENESNTTHTYLVYYLRRSELGDRGRTTLLLELEGASNVSQGRVGVDADLDNPDISNNREFDIEDPKYDAQDSDDVRVGPETSGSPTSSPSA